MLRHAFLMGAALGLAGCASTADFDAPDDGKGPTVSQIIDKIQCEIAEAKKENDDPQLNDFFHHMGIESFDQWVAAATLTLTVSDTEGLTPTSGLPLSYISPLKHAATSFMFGGSPLLYQSRTHTYSQNYSIAMADIPPDLTCAGLKEKWHDFNLEGDLGLREQIYMGLHSFHADLGAKYKPNSIASPNSDSFGATVSFDVYKGVTSLGPMWTLVHFKGPGGGLGFQRDDLHKIIITFAPTIYPIPKQGLAVADLALVKAQATSIATEAARAANNQLVTTQAIQELGNILNNRSP